MAILTFGELRRRRVRNVSERVPANEFADSDAHAPEPIVHFDRPEPGWLQSSFELASGLEVSDASDSVTPEAFESMFLKPASRTSKG